MTSNNATDDWIGGDGGATRVSVRVQPGASKSVVDGLVDGRLRVRVQAPPVGGAANAALCRHLAALLGVSKSKVRVIKGEKSRDKIVEVRAIAPDEARKRLGV